MKKVIKVEASEAKVPRMEALAADIDAVKAVKVLFPLIEEKLQRIDFCWFKHAWLNSSWEPGDTAGSLYYTTNAKFSFYENILMMILNELYKEVQGFKHKYSFSPRATSDGFALDVNIEPEMNESYVGDVKVKLADHENLNLLREKLSEIQGMFRVKVAGEALVFTFNGQTFTAVRSAGGINLSATKPVVKIRRISK